MTEQVKEELSEDSSNRSKSPRNRDGSEEKQGSQVEFNPNVKAQMMARTQQTKVQNTQLVSREEFNRMREKV